MYKIKRKFCLNLLTFEQFMKITLKQALKIIKCIYFLTDYAVNGKVDTAKIFLDKKLVLELILICTLKPIP